MATSIESSSPAPLDKGSAGGFMGGASPTFSPSSEKHFWSTLRNRVDTLLESRKPSLPIHVNDGASDRAKRLKEDSKLLLKGFDSVAHSLSQLSNDLENALQGARDLARPPTLTEIMHCTLEKARRSEEEGEELKKVNGDEDESAEEGSGEGRRGLKRKLDVKECSENHQAEENSLNENGTGSEELERLGKAKNLAISMATKSAALATELKSIKSDLSYMQERCTLLEEENRRLRDGYGNGIRPEEDDLVRLQMEALLAEKSRLANENANLTRENQCLRQLVEYHQLTSQDLSASYENLIRGMGLDFSSPEDLPPQKDNMCNLSKNLDECYDDCL